MNDDVTELLQTLRQQNLAWMADEIATTITNGKIITKDYRESGTRGKKLKGTTSVPFTEKEELEVTLAAIKSYMVDLESTWEEANAFFQMTIQKPVDSPVKILIVPPEGGTPIEPFGRDVPSHRNKLTALLARAWPNGPEDFHKRLSGATE